MNLKLFEFNSYKGSLRSLSGGASPPRASPRFNKTHAEPKAVFAKTLNPDQCPIGTEDNKVAGLAHDGDRAKYEA